MANVKVAVRARPLLPREIDGQSPVVLEMRDKSTILFKSESGVAVGELRDASKEFIYDHSYWSVYKDDPHFTSQEQIFSDLGESILESAFEGYNGCIFAYGQTGSGKTYTMMGIKESPGLIPRICKGLFEGVESRERSGTSFKVEVSYMEIYNEKVRDLLKLSPVKSTGSSSSSQHNLRVREHPKDGPYVENLSKHQVSGYDAIDELISIGNSQRTTAATKMNDVSSRSHAIFTISFVQAKFYHNIPSETVSKIHLVDLAGSERASQTEAEGQRLKEGGSINKSLVCLGNVIQALAEMSSNKHKVRHIPYRDSVLTWLLKDSLGGNSKTIMIATVSPCQYSYGETLSTLRYANRAKNIVNKPKINEDENVKTIRELRNEIKRLKDIIARGENLGDVPLESTLRLAVDLQNKEEKVAMMTRDWADKWDSIQKIIQERDLALRSEGVKMIVESEKPHLLGVDEDKFSAGVVLYHIKVGITTIGNVTATTPNDIALRRQDICECHCKIVSSDDDVSYLHALNGISCINQLPVEPDNPVRLVHGDTLKLGSSTYFRFNHPKEALMLKDTSKDILDNSFSSSVWSPLLNNTSNSSANSDKLIQLERERDLLRQQQLSIENEYEQKILQVEERLKREEQDKADLAKELERLKEEKQNASISVRHMSMPSKPGRYSFSSSAQSDGFSFAVYTPLSERKVTGEEHYLEELRTSSPLMAEYPTNITRQSISSKPDRIGGDFEISQVYLSDDNISDDYLLVENTNSNSSDTSPSQASAVDMVKILAEQEIEELKEKYEERLKREAHEKNKLRSDLLEVELQLQRTQEAEPIDRRRTYGFSGTNEVDLNASIIPTTKPRILATIPAFYLRGIGFTAYHVFELKFETVHGDWNVYRRYEQFRSFHDEICWAYPEVSSLTFPPSKWFGAKSDRFVRERRVHLERYLKAFIAIITAIPNGPLSGINETKRSMDILQDMHPFFKGGPLQASLYI